MDRKFANQEAEKSSVIRESLCDVSQQRRGQKKNSSGIPKDGDLRWVETFAKKGQNKLPSCFNVRPHTSDSPVCVPESCLRHFSSHPPLGARSKSPIHTRSNAMTPFVMSFLDAITINH